MENMTSSKTSSADAFGTARIGLATICARIVEDRDLCAAFQADPIGTFRALNVPLPEEFS